MRVAFLQSLPVRLAGIILGLSGVTLLVLTEINRRAVERILSDQAEVQAVMATNAVVEGLDNVVGGVERMTKQVARDLGGRTIDAAEAERIARNAMLDQPQISGFGVALEPGVAEAGRVGVAVYRSGIATKFLTVDLTSAEGAFWSRDWYREIKDKAVPVWGEPFFDREGTERNGIRLSVPVWRDAGGTRELIGAVTAVVELDWLRRLANTNEFSDTSFTVVFSRTGRIVVHPKANYVIAETIDTLVDKTGAPELAVMREKVIAKRQGALSYAEAITGRRVHANFKPAKAAGWGVIVGYDEAEFLNNQRKFRKLAGAYLGAALLLLGGIVIGVTRRALRPLGQLAVSADEIAKRNLDCAVPETRRADEVGTLASAFREMRDALKAQHLERRWTHQSQEHQLKYNQIIIDSIGELVFVLTKALSISRINQAVTRMAGYTSADLVRLRLLDKVTLTADTAADGAAFMAEALKEGRSLYDLPADLLTKEGWVLPVRLTLVPIKDENRVVGAVATLRVGDAALKRSAE